MSIHTLGRLFLVVLLSNFATSEIEFIAARLPLQGNRPPPGSPWPMPKQWQRDTLTLNFTLCHLNITSDLHNCDVIDQAVSRFMTQLDIIDQSKSDTGSAGDDRSSDGCDYAVEQTWVKIHVQDETCPKYPKSGDREDYTLEISSEIVMNASSSWAVLRGLETLGQLMYKIGDRWFINRGKIQDEPRFQFRGFHMDTARHFYPLSLLKKNLDIMAMHKLNVLHWHIVDSQSFAYQSIKFPELAEKGAYLPNQIYTQEDIKEVIEYARLRGIRVIPEFSTPGHTFSWGKAKPELLTVCWEDGKPEVANYSQHAAREIMDPSKNYTFEFLEELFGEISEVFQDDYIHIGMDEVYYGCWQSSPDIAKFLPTIGLEENDFPGLEKYYNERLLEIIARVNKTAITWEDPINHGAKVSNKTLIHLWKHVYPKQPIPWETWTERALRAGYDVIFSSCWYLNYVDYGQDWIKYYQCDPYNANATEEEKSHILGGAGVTWSEYIDETNFIPRIWPRASAVAERLWSPYELTNIDDAKFRLDQHRCRMLRQGIPAAPILPGFCQRDYNTDNSLLYQPSTQQPKPTSQEPTQPATSTESVTSSVQLETSEEGTLEPTTSRSSTKTLTQSTTVKKPVTPKTESASITSASTIRSSNKQTTQSPTKKTWPTTTSKETPLPNISTTRTIAKTTRSPKPEDLTSASDGKGNTSPASHSFSMQEKSTSEFQTLTTTELTTPITDSHPQATDPHTSSESTSQAASRSTTTSEETAATTYETQNQDEGNSTSSTPTNHRKRSAGNYAGSCFDFSSIAGLISLVSLIVNCL